MCPVTRSSLTVLHHARHTVQKQKQKLRIKPHFFDKIKSMIYFLYSLLISCRLEQPSSRLSNGLPVSLSLIIRALHIFSCGALFLEVRRLLGKAAFPGGRFQSCERSSQLSAGHSNLQAQKAGPGSAVLAAQVRLHAGGQEESLQLQLRQPLDAEVRPD